MRIIMKEAGIEYPLASWMQVRTPAQAAEAAAEIRGDTESFAVLILDSKNGLKAAEIITAGILDASLVHPREVFRAAILRNGAAIILVHNHPSGDATPSAEDIRITKKVVEAGMILDIRVLDSVVLGIASDGQNGQPIRAGHVSLRESGMVQFA
jgi:DNA repair protein RadC